MSSLAVLSGLAVFALAYDFNSSIRTTSEISLTYCEYWPYFINAADFSVTKCKLAVSLRVAAT